MRPLVGPHGCGCSSGVEHNLAKVGVVGSNPIARSKIPSKNQRFSGAQGNPRGASSCWNKARTVPKCPVEMGNVRAACSGKVPKPPDKRNGPAAGGTAREAQSDRTSRNPKHSAKRMGTQYPLADSIYVYNGRQVLGAFVKTTSGFLVLDADGKLIQAVATRRQAQGAIWAAHAGEIWP